MDNGNATWLEVYDGSVRPSALGVLVDGLTNGWLYSFRVLALNYNGHSEPSTPQAYYVCTEPKEFAAPLVIAQTRSSMALQWAPPLDTGGCRITGYAVFRDEGAVAASAEGSGISEELNMASDPDVRDKPSLNTLMATAWPADTVGQVFRL